MAEPGNETEVKTENQPQYDNELSIFDRETKDKLKEFRMARSNWVSPEEVIETLNSNLQGAYASDLYNGRCFILKKIGFKTNRLRNHHKTLRPLHCYTLRRKVSVSEGQEHMKEKLPEDAAQTTESPDTEESTPPLPTEDTFKSSTEKSSKDSVLSDGDTAKHKRRFGKKHRTKKKTPHSKQAFENLKASKHGNRGLKPCTCDDGKELTVVIKGFCLCDKSQINKFKMQKVCEEFQRFQNPKALLAPHATDSLEIYRRRLGLTDSSETSGTGPEDAAIEASKIPLKNVTFEENELERRGARYMTDSLITLFRCKSSQSSDMALTREQFENIKKVSEIQKKEGHSSKT